MNEMPAFEPTLKLTTSSETEPYCTKLCIPTFITMSGKAKQC